MLHRLRRHMALLNAAISGAILLCMALVALGISDRAIVRQYETDLNDSSANLFSIMARPNSNAVVSFATTSNLMIYYERDGKVVMAGKSAESEQEQLQQVVAQARAKVALEMGHALGEASPSGIGDIMFQRVLTAPSVGQTETSTLKLRSATESGDSVPPSVSITQVAGMVVASGNDEVIEPKVEDAIMISITSVPSVLVDADGKSFRVMAAQMGSIPSGDDGSAMLMVMQDRADELAERMRIRWVFFSLAMGGLLLVGLSSLFLSKRAVAPVEASIAQQRAFVAAASHELRTPVAALRANAEVLRDAELGSFEPFLESIELEGGRMTQLVNDLIDLARADAGELQFADETVDVELAVRQTLAVMRPLAERKGIILTEHLESAAKIRGDGARLRQALVALLDNALRYTQQGGHVRVEARRDKQRVVVSVADDGPGIPDAHKQKVFDRFYRVDAARTPDGGSGLGLSVARQIVERMRGVIELRDAEGGTGCIFEMKWKAVK